MRRRIDAVLESWAREEGAPPLLLRGARRVGKTYSIRRLGREVFGEGRFAYFDFQTDLERLAGIFANTADVDGIAADLSAYAGVPVRRGETLIAFDEIQLCEKALNSLRFFAADGGYRVVASGSQLGVTLRDRTLPFPSDVRQVALHPMDFEEWLWAVGDGTLVDAIRGHYQSREPFSLHDMAMDRYRRYVVTGGLPAVVDAYARTGDLTRVREIQRDIDDTYTADIALYAPGETVVATQAVWNSIPKQLARETTRKFKYADVRKGGRERQYRLPLAWLEAAGLVTLNEQTNDHDAPLEARDGGSFFKVYMADTGILFSRYALDARAWLSDERRVQLSARFRGALTENYVMQALTANDVPTYYWASDGGGVYEVEFVTQTPLGQVVPIEVKSGTNVRATSLKRFMAKADAPYAIRVSARNFGFEDNLFSVPLYAAFCIRP
ncbi:ATP-binding protein [Bifidobacterium callitrichos]|uniref:ATPase n=1 Tax=Bifidobacterium callitrichos DSM 23973 TaxID=1437609 RepID=A0A087A4Y6_9BIFI|nr:ATP-binding protein [Bifidobacterium callitrichos]KFI53836.1 ATPase [Bifidobacterium callitrichos DSM 23973]